MPIKAVTFDCAQTLVEVDWNPGAVISECAIAQGHAFDSETGAARYGDLLQARRPEFCRLNRLNDRIAIDEFWSNLARHWAEEFGIHSAAVGSILEEADRRLFGADSCIFRLFPDVPACLLTLKCDGYRLAVISNWDISLHRVLLMHGIDSYFDLVIPSLCLGIEKPDPRIFEHALQELDVPAGSALHVGDHPVDDLHGARSAGMHALLIDRSRPHCQLPYISSLDQLPEVLRSIA